MPKRKIYAHIPEKDVKLLENGEHIRKVIELWMSRVGSIKGWIDNY